MIKGLILSSLIVLSLSFQILKSKSFQNEGNEQNVYLADTIEKGSLITAQIQAQIKNISEQAYIFCGNHSAKNILFIQQQLNILYPGNYVVAIYGFFGVTNTTIDPVLGKNVGISTYSSQGKWWIYWKGANHYQPGQAYYISRIQGNTQNYTCLTNQNFTSSSDVYDNVVQAAQMDFTDIQNFTSKVQASLHQFRADIFPTVSAVDPSLYYFLCAWGSTTSNVIQRTYKQKLMIVSTPRVD